MCIYGISNLKDGSTDGAFLPWSLDLKRHLTELYPLPDGLQPIPDDVLLPPKWTLQRLSNATSEVDQVHTPNQDNAPLQNDIDSPKQDALSIPGSHLVTLRENRRMTPEAHWQDVRHFSFTSSEHIDYMPGDIMTIYPQNDPADVSTLLELLQWTEHADYPLTITPTTSSSPSSSGTIPLPQPLPHLPQNPTLRTLLTAHLDLTAIPRRSFFTTLAHFTTDAFQKERLLEFANPIYTDELYDYTTRPRRSILEVLGDFDTVKIPWTWALSIFPVLRGRQFSIASGGVLKHSHLDFAKAISPSTSGEVAPVAEEMQNATRPKFPPSSSRTRSSLTSNVIAPKTRFDLLIAIVSYRTVIKKIRRGVCTRYLTSLALNSSLHVTITRGGLGIDPALHASTPLLMIAPGTGVAPMRSLVWERAAWKAEGREVGEAVLVFGGRGRRRDAFYWGEWAAGTKVSDDVGNGGERIDRAEALAEAKSKSRSIEGVEKERQDADEHDGHLRDMTGSHSETPGYTEPDCPDLDIELHAAWSRDQREKVYVQDIIRQQGTRVWALIQSGARVFVCGSSGKMPAAVREALVAVFEREGDLERAEAEGMLAGLERAGRYLQETW